MNSTDQNVISIIQSKFTSGGTVRAVHLNTTLNQGWVQENRILVLIEYNSSFAVFVLISTQPLPTAFSDLTIERAIPVDSDFCCEIDNETTRNNNKDDVALNIISAKFKLSLILKTGIESSNFVAEVYRCQEASRNLGVQDFQWLQKYIGTKNNMDTDNLNTHLSYEHLDSPDIVVSRQKIAQGQPVNVNTRESILRYQLALKEGEYTHIQEFRVFVGTWNVNGQPPTIPLHEWLSCDADPPDVYAVGFQELDLSKEAFLFNDTPREEEWRKAVLSAIHPNAKYRMVALVRLVGMLLMVMVRIELYPYVKNVAIDTVGTGIMGKMGNKGGVSVRLELHSTSLCFVNSHLAAHTEEVERRNQDYHDICVRTNFKRTPQAIKDHDQIYWLGDLNYRITELTASEVKSHLSVGNIETVLLADQLIQQHIMKGRVLVGYTEGPIMFQPTYKYDPGTDHYDTSEKARAPAWCDRILYRGSGISQLCYRSHPQLRISDHKPVSAVFKSQVKVIDSDKYSKTHEEILKKMDKLENEFLPQVTVDQTDVVFDTVKFLETQTRDIIIANTGQVPVQFEFIKKLDDASYCKEWLKITPYCGDIKPGEKCDVQLEVQLESALETLYDILVLHLEGGKDVFITVSGQCQRTCFTTSFSALCRAAVPLAHLSLEQLAHADSGRAPLIYTVPREMWLLVDYLHRHGLRHMNLFESRSLDWELVQVRDWLDTGAQEFAPEKVHVVAEALLMLLSYTADPLIPYRLHPMCIAAAANYSNCEQIIITKLPDFERNIFLYLCLFLQELLQHKEDNGLDAKTLATVFGDVILRDPVRNSKPQASRGKAAFVYQFLVNDQSHLIARK